MFEHEWKWQRALIAGLVAPAAATLAVAIFYRAISWLVVLLFSGDDGDPGMVHIVRDFYEGDLLPIMSVGTAITGIVLMVVLGIPISLGLSKITRYTKAAYIAASLLAFPIMVLLLSDGPGGSLPTSPKDLFFLGYFVLITLLNGWVAHWIVHGKRKRPPEKIEAVFQ